MCMWDGGDGPEVARHRTVRARKPHQCTECGRTIEVGEQYQYDFQVYDGSPGTWHTCQHCRVAQQWLIRECGGYLIEGTWEDIQEHITEYPKLKRPLGRLLASRDKKWRMPDGTLMPLPGVLFLMGLIERGWRCYRRYHLRHRPLTAREITLAEAFTSYTGADNA